MHTPPVSFGARHVFRLFDVSAEGNRASSEKKSGTPNFSEIEEKFFRQIPDRLIGAYQDASKAPLKEKFSMPSTLIYTSPIPDWDGKTTQRPLAPFTRQSLQILGKDTFTALASPSAPNTLITDVATRRSYTEMLTGKPMRERFAFKRVATDILRELNNAGFIDRVYVAQLKTDPFWVHHWNKLEPNLQQERVEYEIVASPPTYPLEIIKHLSKTPTPNSKSLI